MPDQKTIDTVVDLERKYGDGHHSFELREGIFELIMAARMQERDECALLVGNMSFQLDGKASRPSAGMTNEDQGRLWDMAEMLHNLSQAIRNRK